MSELKNKILLSMRKRQAKKQARIRQEFLPEALEIVEKPISPTGHLLVIILASIVVFVVFWSIFGKMDEVVTARGMVLTVSGIQEVQTATGGIVEEICVQEGSTVKAGDAIVKIDSSINRITLSNTTESLQLLEYQNTLLNELAAGNDISCIEAANMGDEADTVYNYVKTMEDSFLARKAEAESNIKQAEERVKIEKDILDKMAQNKEYLEGQKASLQAVLQYANAQEQAKQKIAIEIAYKQGVLADYKKLYEAGAVAKAEVESLETEIAALQKDYEAQNSQVVYENFENNESIYELENQILTAQKDYLNQESAVSIAKTQYEQAKESLNALDKEFRAGIASLIVQNTENINIQKSNKEIQTINVEDQTLVAPVSGTVRTLEINTVGGVVATAQTVATIVPDDSQMIVEVDIKNQDIGYIQNGQEVVIKLDTFDFQEYGKVKGNVAYISPDAVWVDNYGWIYKAKIAINKDVFQEKNPDAEIGVGMQCTAEVKIGERRIIDFFLAPIVEHFDGSLKVR
ncbi:MAG: HlyD family efflux transporter periplasmic adaptor subunit [Lachnospiraceae bacterium]|nr:HlyD family efflux transporter periplasmic adaptor subunit [Lachnospiraceae bacterium]